MNGNVVSLRPRAGSRAWVAGAPGFYVVNPTTNIATGSYGDRQSAERHAQEMNDKYPLDPVKLIVAEIQEGA